MLNLIIKVKNISSYFISGSVSNAKLNIPGYESLNDLNFNFQTQDKITKISNLNFIYQKI